MTTVFFGARWDAPALEGAEPVPTPVGRPCLECGEPIREGDRGLLRPYLRVVDHTTGDATASVEAVHLECDLRMVLGHQVGVCPCHGYGTSRDAGMATLAAVNAGRAAQGLDPL